MSTDPAARAFSKKVVRRLARAADVPLASAKPAAKPAAKQKAKPKKPKVPPRIVFVLGSQRSGTNALRRSLSLDPWLMGFNERANDKWYADWAMKPEAELRSHLLGLPTKKVLFKPIVNLQTTPVAQFLEPWDAYNVSVAWIYRDPIDVYLSRKVHWDGKDDVDDFVAEWRSINAPVVDAIDADARISLVRYDDLAADSQVFWGLCRRLNVRGENLFRASASKAPSQLTPEVIAGVTEGCADVIADLDRRRTFVPTPAADASA